MKDFKEMNMARFLMFLLLFSFSPLYSQNALINKYKGKVYVYDQAGEKVDIRKVKTLNEGYSIKTGPKSECELLFKDGSVLFLSEGTSFKIEKAGLTEKERDYGFKLAKGKILFFIKKIERAFNKCRVNTPTAVCAVRGTDFSIITSSASSNIGLFEGALDVEKDDETARLEPGQEAAVAREITVANRLSSLMMKEKQRADKLKKYVEKIRSKLEKRTEFINQKMDKTRNKLNDFYKKSSDRAEKPAKLDKSAESEK